jgi:hypothetical protein
MQGRSSNRVGFIEFLEGVGFDVVKAWLAVLLGGFEMDRYEGSEFYDGAGIIVDSVCA